MSKFEQLWAAVFADDVAAIDRALEGVDVNHVMPSGERAVHCAATYASEKALGHLIAKGADVDAASTQYGATPLHLACERGNAKIVEILLAAGANPQIRDIDLNDPIDLAASYGDPRSVNAILNALGHVDLGLRPFEFALNAAVCDPVEPCEAIVDYWVRNGVSLRTLRDSSGNSVAHLAAEAGRAHVLNMLIDRGASVGWINEDGDSVIKLVTKADMVEVIRHLDELGVSDVYEPRAALDDALDAGAAEISLYLCTKLGLSLDEPDPQDWPGQSLLSIIYQQGGDAAIVEDFMRRLRAQQANDQISLELDAAASVVSAPPRWSAHAAF